MRRLLLAVVLLALMPAAAQGSYLHLARAQRAGVHGAKFFVGGGDKVVVSLCRHGQPKVVYCHVTETGPAITALGWDTMDYVIAVMLSHHQPRLVVNGGFTKNWYEPL